MLVIILIKFYLSGFKKEGIVHESSCITTPRQNRVVERKNRHLLECTRALLFQQNVPKSYWGNVVLTSAYVVNGIPSRVLGFKSPLETLSQFYLDIRSSFSFAPQVFGCTSFVHIHNNRGKLDPRALKCVFVGYSSTQKGYKCYHPSTRKLCVSANVTFVENESYFSTPYLQGELSILEDKELALPPLEIIPSSKSFKSKETTSVLPISSKPIPILQSKEYRKRKKTIRCLIGFSLIRCMQGEGTPWQQLGNFVFQLMLPLLKMSHTSPLLIFKGNYLYLKIRS